MTAASRSATVPRLIFVCSVRIKLAAEGERLALRYCEESRRIKNIISTCRLIGP